MQTIGWQKFQTRLSLLQDSAPSLRQHQELSLASTEPWRFQELVTLDWRGRKESPQSQHAQISPSPWYQISTILYNENARIGQSFFFDCGTYKWWPISTRARFSSTQSQESLWKVVGFSRVNFSAFYLMPWGFLNYALECSQDSVLWRLSISKNVAKTQWINLWSVSRLIIKLLHTYCWWRKNSWWFS